MTLATQTLIRPQEARAELARRELARRRLLAFMEYASPWYRAGQMHELVAGYLEQVEAYIRTRGMEGIGRLLIFTPPRHGKSELVSKHFPAWVLGRLPDTRVILTSYGADLAVRNSRAARELVMDVRFEAVFGQRTTRDAPVELSEDSRSVQAWDLARPHRGGVLAAGVGGGITGQGAHLFVVDDPFKNREEAESESRREMVWEWWTSSAYTRLEDGAAVVGMLTRWHQDDWAGKLLKLMATDPKADQYVVVNLPAIWERPETNGKKLAELRRLKLLEGVWVEEHDQLGRKPGEALWPEKYDHRALDQIRRNIGEYDFEALYQQNPYLRSGSYFRRDWFTVVEAPPKIEEIVQRIWVWDKAGSLSGTGDFAAGGVLTLTKDDVVVVEKAPRRQCTPHERDEMMRSEMVADRETGRPAHVVWHQQDPGSAGLDSAMATNRMLGELGFAGRYETVTGDKEVRAGPWSSALQGGQVRLVRGAWNEPFIEEHIAFPKGRYDDQVDWASWGFGKLKRYRLSGKLMV